MIPSELIERKRNGGTLGSEELAAFFDGYLRGEVANYQVASLLMAIWFQGMSQDETLALTRTMLDSGERWTWPDGPGPMADKHSTGGVGDKVSLVLAPTGAACGLRIPMVSGRGLAHTAGTIDKLESIPGYRTDLSRREFDRLLNAIGFGMSAQTETFAPLDRKLYALRDVTATVDSVPLITASIMSKKMAEGLDTLIMDVKWGDGAFMKDPSEAEILARGLIEVGGEFGVRTEALLTDMTVPLGRTVGHSLELKEAIAMLRGDTAERRFGEVTRALTTRLLILSGVAASEEEAREKVDRALSDGSALDRFRANVEAQGGDPAVIDGDGLPKTEVRRPVMAQRGGWLVDLPARTVGLTLVNLGGGRRIMGDTIDHAVGFEFLCAVGERAEEGEPWCVIHAHSKNDAEQAAATLESAAMWSDDEPPDTPAVTKRITASDF